MKMCHCKVLKTRVCTVQCAPCTYYTSTKSVTIQSGKEARTGKSNYVALTLVAPPNLRWPFIYKKCGVYLCAMYSIRQSLGA